MSDVEIKGKIVVDTGSAAKSTTELNNEIKATKKALQDAKIGSDEYKAAQAQLKAQQDQLTQATTAANDSHTKSAGAFSLLKEKVGALAPGMQGAVGATNSLSTAFKLLLANPIGLILLTIVGALKLLYDAFASTAEGADKLSFIFDGLKGVVKTVSDTILSVGSAIVKFFKGDFKGAMEEGSKAVTGFGDRAVESFNRAYDASKKLDEIQDSMAALNVERAKANADLKKSKELLNDENASFADKKKAIEAIGQIENSLAAQELKLASDKVAAIKEKNKAQIEGNTLSQEQIDEMQEAEIDFYNKQEQQAGTQIQIQKQRRALDSQEAAERKAIHADEMARKKEADEKARDYWEAQKKRYDEWEKTEKAFQKMVAEGKTAAAADMAAEKERLRKEDADAAAAQKKNEADNLRDELTNKKKLAALNLANDPDSAENKIAKLKADLALELSTLADGDLQKQVLAQQTANAITQIETEQKEAKKKIEDEKEAEFQKRVSAVADGLGTLSELAGKQTAAGKALAIAQTVINTYQAGFAAFKGMVSSISGPVGIALGVVAAAGAVASGIASVKKITAVQIPGQSGSGGAVPTAPTMPTAPLMPKATITTLDQASINGVGNAAQGGVGRVFVLDSDINNASERNARINRAARLA